MLLEVPDNQILSDITFWFCSVTSFIFSTLLAGLLISDGYLLLGKYVISPVFSFIFLLEIVKWLLAQWKYLEEASYKPKGKIKYSLIFSHLLKSVSLKEAYKSTFTIFASVLFYFFISVVYGAELFSNHEQTFMFCALLTLLTVFPICLNLGHRSIIHLISGHKPINVLHYYFYRNIRGTLLGAWLGAFVIPLDWDKPWQEWPISCSLGALVGFTASNYISLIFSMFPFSHKLFKVQRKNF
jgi:phosphatidylinositol glycan class F